MFRGRGWILISVSLVLAALAAVVATRWVNARAAAFDAAKPGLMTVAVAAMEIPFGTQIEARHVSTIDMLAGTAPSGVFSDPKQIIGKVARGTIMRGELLLDGRFVEAGGGSTLAAVVAPNMRAVSVRVDDVVGVGGFLLPGNRVDVVESHEVEREVIAETILSNIKVLAIDQNAAADSNEPALVRAVTLEVSPEGAEVIMRAKARGKLQLTLRNPLDESVHVAKVVAPPPPAPVTVIRQAPRQAQPTMTVIRGTAITNRTGS